MKPAALLLPLFALTSAVASAQLPNLPLNFESTIGSLKMINCTGVTTISFEGTILLIDVQGDVKVEGNLKKEFDSANLKRKTYFGKGKVTVSGKWRGIQIFGSHIKGTVKITQGRSRVRFHGEFDQNLDTGFYWYGDKVKDKLPWYATGIEVDVPENPAANPRPTRRGGYGG